MQSCEAWNHLASHRIAARMLEQIGPRIWSHEAIYRFGALAIPHRVTVLQSEDGGLVVHSPAKPDRDMIAALTRLGPVRSIVWPSWWHDLYLRAWAKTYPDALLFVAPQLHRAIRGNANGRVLSETATPSPDLDAVYVDRLAVCLDEFVFLHRPSRTLIVADLVVNVKPDLPQPSKAFFSLLGAYPGPMIPWFYPRVARRQLPAAFSRILAWDFDSMVVGHGEVIRTGAHGAFACAVERLRLR